VEKSRLAGPSLKAAGAAVRQPAASPTSAAVSLDRATTPGSPESVSASVQKTLDHHREVVAVSREDLLDLVADNRAIASRHRLHPKTRSSVLQAGHILYDIQFTLLFSARCNIYISRLCYDVGVRLSVRLSVTEVH